MERGAREQYLKMQHEFTVPGNYFFTQILNPNAHTHIKLEVHTYTMY